MHFSYYVYMILFSILAYTAFGILCIYFIKTGIRKLNEMQHAQPLSDLYTDEEEHDKAIQEAAEFEQAYFERVRNGEQTQQFLTVGGQLACSMIRSLLFAENIPTYTENEHVNSFYSLNNLSSSSAFSIKVFILVADYDRAYEIVSDFVSKCEKAQAADGEEKSEAPEKDSESVSDLVKPAAKAAGALVTGCFFIPMPDGSQNLPMGITILPRI